jgi:hypothetical protein
MFDVQQNFRNKKTPMRVWGGYEFSSY